MKQLNIKHEDTKLEHKSGLLPQTYLRIIIAGDSGSGKTYILKELLPMLHPFAYLIIYSTTVDQPFYRQLSDIYSKMKGHSVMTIKDAPDWKKIEENEEALMEHKHNLIIIDDQMPEVMKKNVFPFLSMSRHKHCSVILIYQKYHDIPKPIRENANMTLLFHTNDMHRTIYMSFPGLFNYDIEYFKHVMKLLDKPYNFVTLDFSQGIRQKDKVKERFGIEISPSFYSGSNVPVKKGLKTLKRLKEKSVIDRIPIDSILAATFDKTKWKKEDAMNWLLEKGLTIKKFKEDDSNYMFKMKDGKGKVLDLETVRLLVE